MSWRIEYCRLAIADLSDWHYGVHVERGLDAEEAEAQGADRIALLRRRVRSIPLAPFRGTLRSRTDPEIRNLTFERFIVWFDIRNETEMARLLGVFYGGQNHLVRLAAPDPDPGEP